MPHTVAERVHRWILTSDSEEIGYQRIYDMGEYFAEWRYNQYLPTVGPYPDFMERLRAWLDKLHDEEDQKLLFRLIPHIFFITQREFATLYRVAFKGVITRWLIDAAGISFSVDSIESFVLLAEKETWFCPITDSMEIAAFYHANRIEGQDLRPDWYSLAKLGCREEILRYMDNKGLKRLVLLEDFVGSGSQIADVLRFAASLSSSIPILAVPLIICPKGVELAKSLVGKYDNLQITPILPLPEETFVNPVPVPNEPNVFGSIRDLIKRIADRVSGSPAGNNYYGPFGYNGTGALVVTYSNCPDNTLPVIHYESSSWKALFPRSSRI